MREFILCLLLCCWLATVVRAEPVRILCLGDSITKGVRSGVTEAETYEVLLQDWLSTHVVPVQVINVGIGGERTDGCLPRMAQELAAHKPDIVTFMYGTNDAAWEEGKPGPRLPLADYERNLHTIVERLRAAGAKPVLMTSPPLGLQFAYMQWSPYREKGPNWVMAPYIHAARAVAADEGVPIVDNFAWWSELALMGTDIDTLMTDGCHPNPAGHVQIARAMYPVLARLLGGDPSLPGAAPEPPPPPPAEADGNLALKRPYAETDRNAFGYAAGLTDGVTTSDQNPGVYATGMAEEYPKLTTIDLGEVTAVGRIAVHNSRDGNTKAVTLSVSADGEQFDVVGEHVFEQADGFLWNCAFEQRQARYVRIAFLDSWLVDSHGSKHFMFLREVQVFAE